MRVIVFGATGMVGQGVLRECLLDAGIERVLVVGRSPTGVRNAWVQAAYVVTSPLWSVLRRISPNLATTTEQMGRAMIHVARAGYTSKVLEMKDINSL